LRSLTFSGILQQQKYCFMHRLKRYAEHHKS
jgi:hypothetical protein